MHEDKLFFKDDINGNAIFYLDENCTEPYTGKLEEYFQGFLNVESDIVDGFKNGISKEYYKFGSELKSISQMRYNLNTGLMIEFYKDGSISGISLSVNEYALEYVYYDENGNIEYEKYREKTFETFKVRKEIKGIVQELLEKYDLRKINEEIMREGKNFDYKKYFGL